MGLLQELFNAASKGNMSGVKAALDKGDDINWRNPEVVDILCLILISLRRRAMSILTSSYSFSVFMEFFKYFSLKKVKPSYIVWATNKFPGR